MTSGVGGPGSPFLTVEDVATRYRTSPSTVRYWASVGTGPQSARIGKRRLYRLDDLLSWEAEQFKLGAAS